MSAPRTDAAPVRFAGHTFDEMAHALRVAATGEAFGLEALEVLAAAQEQPVFVAAVEDVRRQGTALGAAHALLLALARHETEIAALLRERV